MISVSMNGDGFREGFGEGFEEGEPATSLFGFFRFTMTRAPLLSYPTLYKEDSWETLREEMSSE
jgi:hypothetical protein